MTRIKLTPSYWFKNYELMHFEVKKLGVPKITEASGQNFTYIPYSMPKYAKFIKKIRCEFRLYEDLHGG